MALLNSTDMLKKANKNGYAVGNFDVFNIEMINGVLSSAEKTESPVILAFAEPFEEFIPLEQFATVAKDAATRSSVPVALHLDHANNLPFIQRAIACGFTSVMIDASDKSLKENIRITSEISALCRPKDISVEAELGHVGGLEGTVQSDDLSYDTNVEEAREFVSATAVDSLAVSIGTVHGVYQTKPALNLARLDELKKALWIPLVLHGGSGLSNDELRDCIKLGINKVNIFTDLALAAMESAGSDAKNNTPYIECCCHITTAVAEVAEKRMAVIGSVGNA